MLSSRREMPRRTAQLHSEPSHGIGDSYSGHTLALAAEGNLTILGCAETVTSESCPS